MARARRLDLKMVEMEWIRENVGLAAQMLAAMSADDAAQVLWRVLGALTEEHSPLAWEFDRDNDQYIMMRAGGKAGIRSDNRNERRKHEIILNDFQQWPHVSLAWGQVRDPDIDIEFEVNAEYTGNVGDPRFLETLRTIALQCEELDDDAEMWDPPEGYADFLRGEDDG